MNNQTIFSNQRHDPSNQLFTNLSKIQSPQLRQAIREFEVQMYNSLLQQTAFIPTYQNNSDNLNQVKRAGQQQEAIIRQLCGQTYADIETFFENQKAMQQQKQIISQNTFGEIQPKQKSLTDKQSSSDAQPQSKKEEELEPFGDSQVTNHELYQSSTEIINSSGQQSEQHQKEQDSNQKANLE